MHKSIVSFFTRVRIVSACVGITMHDAHENVQLVHMIISITPRLLRKSAYKEKLQYKFVL